MPRDRREEEEDEITVPPERLPIYLQRGGKGWLVLTLSPLSRGGERKVSFLIHSEGKRDRPAA